MKKDFLPHPFIWTPVLLVLIVICYFFVDKPLAFALQGVPFEGIYKATDRIIAPSPNVLLWPIIFYIVFFLFKKRSAGRKILFIALCVNCSNLLVVILKSVFGRYRPSLLFQENLYGFHFFSTHNPSFPSGHSVTVAAVMFALACLDPKRLFLYVAIGFILAFGRVFVGDHYLSDVLGSFLVAYWVARLIYPTVEEFHEQRRRA